MYVVHIFYHFYRLKTIYQTHRKAIAERQKIVISTILCFQWMEAVVYWP